MPQHHPEASLVRRGLVTVRLAPILVLLLAALPALALVPCAGSIASSGYAMYYFYAPGTGACDFAGDDSAALVAAMNPVDFAASAMCGRWVRVVGPLGAVTVRVVDLSPELPVGEIDLNQPAFAMIANLSDGRVPITWETVASPLAENVSVHIKPGSNAYWTGVQVRHHRYGIAALEYLAPSGYVNAPRASYNSFIIDGSLGVPLPISQPFTVRLTDVNGQALVVGGLTIIEGHDFPTGQQFPLCFDASPVPPLPVRPDLALLPPSPNPFNPRTTLAFDLPARAPVDLRVFDLAGRLVATLLDGVVLDEGRHGLEWDGRDGAGRPAVGGTYLLRLESAGQVQVRKALLLK